MKSDNGPPFQSSEFKSFAEHAGFQHKKITPEWPQANSELKRFMRTIEKAIHGTILEGKVWKQEMYRFRDIPHGSTGVAPATTLFNRNIRTTVSKKQRGIRV